MSVLPISELQDSGLSPGPKYTPSRKLVEPKGSNRISFSDQKRFEGFRSFYKDAMPDSSQTPVPDVSGSRVGKPDMRTDSKRFLYRQKREADKPCTADLCAARHELNYFPINKLDPSPGPVHDATAATLFRSSMNRSSAHTMAVPHSPNVFWPGRVEKSVEGS